jgi:hypothetical protein
MAYIGNRLADSYTSFAKQDFTTSATTSYTLDYPVANANEIALFINFVRQEPTTAYSATGTSLTLTSATSATDDMYAVFLGKALQTVNPPAGSVGTSQLANGAVTLAKTDGNFGKVLQVVQATDETARSTTSGTYVTASNTLLVNITPSSTSSKILIMVNTSAYHNATSSTMNGAIFKNGSILKTITYGFKRDDDSAVISGVYLDSPATTSSIAYQLYFSMSTGTAFINASNTLGTITAMEIAG